MDDVDPGETQGTDKLDFVGFNFYIFTTHLDQAQSFYIEHQQMLKVTANRPAGTPNAASSLTTHPSAAQPAAGHPHRLPEYQPPSCTRTSPTR